MGISSRMAWAFGSICLMSSLFAEDDNEIVFASPSPSFGKVQMANIVKRLESAEQKVDQISETKISKSLGIKNPCALGCIGGKKGIFTQLSFLYWKAIAEGFNYAAEVSEADSEVISKYRHVKFEPTPGIRYALGYTSGYDAWNFQGIYTWLRFSGHRTGTADDWTPLGDHGFVPNLIFQDDLTALGVFRTADAHWRMNYHVGDLQFGRGFFITKALALQPLLGARFALLSQKASCYFIDSTLHFFHHDFPFVEKYVSHVSYWGIGPRIGVDAKWTLPCNVGVTGLLTGSLLYGELSRKIFWYEPVFRELEPLEETGKKSESYYSIVPNLQLALGLDWGMSFDKDRMYWGLNCAWEFNYFWQPLPFENVRQHPQPFEIQGLTFRADLHF